MRASDFVKKKPAKTLTIFDIDDTLFHTTAKIKVVKDGKVIQTLTNQEFNNYELQPGEEFDFGEFRDAKKFAQESEPIEHMMDELKTILDHSKGTVIMLTARADFDDKQTFLKTFTDHGIDMSRIHIHRAGNLPGDAIPAEKKAIWVRRYLDTNKYNQVSLYDDSMSNLRVFKSLKKEYPDVDFDAYYITPDDVAAVEGRGKRRRKTNSLFSRNTGGVYGAWGPGPYGGYGHDAGYSGDGDGGGGESVTEAKHSNAVTELKTALLDKKDQLQSATNDKVYAIIDRMMTRIAKSHDISGKELHDLWVDKYQQIPDKWIMKENAEQTSSDKAIFLNSDTVIVGQEHGKKLKLSPEIAKKVKDIAKRHGAWYEGNGMDRKLTAGIIDDYKGSWDDDLLSPAIKGYPAPFLYVLFSNIKENDTVEGKIGFDPESTIFDRILDTQPSTNYFPDRQFDAETLQKFLQAVSEGKYDFVRMSQAPATESNVRKFFTQGERLMFPNNWEEYPYRAGRVAKSVNDLRDKFLASRKRGVYVAGSDHLRAVQQFLDQNKQDIEENFADGKNPGRKGLSKRMGVPTKASVGSLRKIVKSSSGEKQRMAHWLANMKSGKSKK